MLQRKLIEKYLLNDDLSTYDPYDIWKTGVGIKTKKLYYKNKYIGLIPAGLLSIYDIYINNRLRISYKKQEYPIVRAQAALSLMNLYKKVNNPEYLEYAKKHIDWLLNNYCTGYSGYCWGIGFDWIYSSDRIYNRNTPFSTHTPYPLEAIVEYYNLTKDDRLIDVIKSVYGFLENDLKIMKEDKNELIMSYGAEKDRIVVNSNSYIMYMYALLIPFFENEQDYIKNKIRRIYSFVSRVQGSDGSWVYAPFDSKSFIDCFHSAFVIKNIIKTSNRINLENSDKAVQKGIDYIYSNFFDQDIKLFKRFSKNNKISLTKFDLYDNAEMLLLAKLRSDEKMTALINNSIKKNFLEEGGIYSMLDLFGFKKNKNTLRWAVMPYLLAASL